LVSVRVVAIAIGADWSTFEIEIAIGVTSAEIILPPPLVEGRGITSDERI